MIEDLTVSEQKQSSSILEQRLETAQRVLLGKMSPIERRQRLIFSRLGLEPSDENDSQEENKSSENTAPNTSKRASSSGTASKSDIEQAAPKVGASRGGRNNSRGEQGDNETETVESRTPSMSEAGKLR